MALERGTRLGPYQIESPELRDMRITPVLILATVIGGLLLAHDGRPQDAAASEPYSAELRALYDADQAERTDGTLSPEHDAERLARVKELHRAEGLETAEDLYHAAMILQHSADLSGRDHLLAHVLGSMAAANGHEPVRWLSAAALDRFLVFSGHSQFFGTQFERDDGGRWSPGTVDPARTGRLRTWFGIPDAATLLQRAEGFNRGS